MLTPDQLTAIDRHLRKDNWLLNEDLIAELTDHYANAIADKLIKGVSFDMALIDVHNDFGGRKGLLHMEETYQTEKSKQIDVYVWREVRRMMQGDRWPIVLGAFVVLYNIHTYLGAVESVDSFLYIGMLYTAFTVLLAMVSSFILFLRKEVNAAVTQTTPKLFLWAYGLGLSLMAVNKYLLPHWHMTFSADAVLLLNTLLETLCIVYYIAMAMGLWKFFYPNRTFTKA